VDGGVPANPAAYFTNAPNWGQYVIKGDFDNPSPDWAACDPDNAGMGCSDCLNGGAIRAFEVPGEGSCANLTASDALGAFDWICNNATGQPIFFSTGLKDDKAMADLVLPTGDGWRENVLTVNNGSSDVFASASAVWWDNPVKEASGGVTGGSAVKGTIYVVATDSMANFDITGSDGIAIVILPGATLTAAGTTRPIEIRGSDHLWIEGDIDATGAPYGVFTEDVRCSDFRNLNTEAGATGLYLGRDSHSNFLHWVTTSNATSVGVRFIGTSGSTARDNLLLNVTANGNGKGIDLTRVERPVLFNVTANNNTGMGIEIDNGVEATLTSIQANDNTGQGVGVSGVLEIDSLEATNNGEIGFSMWGENCIVSNLTISGSGSEGIRLDGPENCNFINLESTSNTGTGLFVNHANGDGANDNELSTLTLVGNGADGLSVNGGSISFPTENNSFINVLSAQNGNYGITVGAERNHFQSVRIYNNADDGLVGSGGNTTYVDVIVAGNGGIGTTFQSGEGNAILNATVANHPDVGVNMAGGGQTLLSNVCSINNTYGLNYLTSGNKHTASGIAAINNVTNEIKLNSSDVFFTNALRLGSAQCDVNNSLGLEDLTCANTGLSDATATSSLTTASSIVGKVTADDTVNSSDTNGVKLFDDDPQWWGFDNVSRTWGMDGSAYPNADHQGPCGAGQTCRIWDFSVVSADAAIKDIHSLPDGNAVLTKIWALSDEPMDQADCDAEFAGTSFNDATTPNQCESQVLNAAIELYGDAIGDDDGLCESNETCLFSPNSGAYQGHGNVVSAGAFVDGTLTGITLMKYETNGR
jgi:hypothetical protein